MFFLLVVKKRRKGRDIFYSLGKDDEILVVYVREINFNIFKVFLIFRI